MEPNPVLHITSLCPQPLALIIQNSNFLCLHILWNKNSSYLWAPVTALWACPIMHNLSQFFPCNLLLQVLHILFHLISPYWYHCMHSFVNLSDERKQSCQLFWFPKDCIWAIQCSYFSVLRMTGSSTLHIWIQVTCQTTIFTTRNSYYYLTFLTIVDILSHCKTSFSSVLWYNVQNSVQIPYKVLIWFWNHCPCKHTIELLT